MSASRAGSRHARPRVAHPDAAEVAALATSLPSTPHHTGSAGM